MTPRIYRHPVLDELSLARVLAALSDPTRLEKGASVGRRAGP